MIYVESRGFFKKSNSHKEVSKEHIIIFHKQKDIISKKDVGNVEVLVERNTFNRINYL